MSSELELLKVGGPLALAIFVIWQIVKMNLNALNDQRDDFNVIITNHLKHDAELHEKTIDAMYQLQQTQKENMAVMKEMISFLKK